jgi:hypothetical protein
LLLSDPRVDGSNPGRANQINLVSKSVVTARASGWSTITQYYRHGYLPSFYFGLVKPLRNSIITTINVSKRGSNQNIKHTNVKQ